MTIGELQRGIGLIRHRGDHHQSDQLAAWFEHILSDYADAILPIDDQVARVWGHLRVPDAENALDKLIAATALCYDLTAVTRNETDLTETGVRVINPFH